jgi:CheY-like chemotaxis protein
MNIDAWTKLIGILISLLQVILWPLIILSILLYLRGPLKKFLDNLNEFTFKFGSVEATARRQLQVGIALGAANVEQKVDSKASTEQEIARLVNQLVTPQTSRQLEGTIAIWVDDKPLNNTYQRNALEALGIRFAICTSTEDALKELRSKRFDLIISDMGRPSDSRAGYTLLEEVKKMNIAAPFIIYARGGNQPGNKEEARKRGAYEWVTGPQALFEAVISAIINNRKDVTK